LRLYADTSLLIATARGTPEALRAITENSGIFVIPAIAYYEFYVGIKKGEIKYGERFEEERAFIESLIIEFPDRAILQKAAEIRAICEAKGINASDADYMIVAHAVEGAGAIITADKDIKRIADTADTGVKVIEI